MKQRFIFSFTLLFIIIIAIGCSNEVKQKIITTIGSEEYTRLMNLSLDDFDQSSQGFRQYSNDYELVRLVIPEYIKVNKLATSESRNLHWHLGQMHAFNDNYKEAIAEMKQSYLASSKTWQAYVDGTIAFLEKDKQALIKALELLNEQDNQMNIEFLEKFIKYFDQSYRQAYNADL